MAVKRHKVTVTTNGSGAATEYSPGISGVILAIHYVKGNFSDGVDFTITSEETGETIWTESNVNASKSCAPRMATHSTAGVAATYDGTRAVGDRIGLHNDRVSIAVASGGAATTGTFHIVVES